MTKKYVQLYINADGSYYDSNIQQLVANSKYQSVIQVITPLPIDTVVQANYYVRGANREALGQYLMPSVKKGVDLSTDQHVADWNVFEIDIKQKALAYISRYRAGQVFIAVNFKQNEVPALATVFKGHFGKDKPLPEVANDGDYYVCDTYNYVVGNDVYTFDNYAYYDNGGFKRSNYNSLVTSGSVEVSVDPNIEVDIEVEEDGDLLLLLVGRVGLVENDLNSHINDFNNPHNVTAEQVGTYTTAEIDAKLGTNGGGSGGNSNEPDGVTIVLNEDDELEVNLKYIMDGGYL